MWKEHKRWVRRAIRYVESHLKDDIDYDDIAQHTAVSRFYLHRIFMAHVGMSAASYLRERRLTQAAIELMYTNKRILDIALEYRFAGQDSFTRAFKQHYRFTPQQYRKGFRPFQRTEEMSGMQHYEDASEEQVLSNQVTAPKGWLLTGVYPHQYEVGVDQKVVHRGRVSGTIKGSVNANTQGFGTLMQMFKADQFRGKRLRLSGFVRTDGVQMAMLWLRIDGGDEEPLAFDNMQDRPITGTTDWMAYEIVLKVADQAHAVAFGVILSGPGQVWIDGLRLEEVDETVPTTDVLGKAAELPEMPINLDFEQI